MVCQKSLLLSKDFCKLLIEELLILKAKRNLKINKQVVLQSLQFLGNALKMPK